MQTKITDVFRDLDIGGDSTKFSWIYMANEITKVPELVLKNIYKIFNMTDFKVLYDQKCQEYD